MRCFVFASRRALTRFSSMSFVLLMDSTYKTNRFDMPLLLISSVDQFGKSYVVACCLLRDETTASCNLALAAFKSLFGSTSPSVDTIITDQDNALINAIDGQFPTSKHQLCCWHLNMNVRKKFATNPLLCMKFVDFMYSKTEDKAEYFYSYMINNCSAKQKT